MQRLYKFIDNFRSLILVLNVRVYFQTFCLNNCFPNQRQICGDIQTFVLEVKTLLISKPQRIEQATITVINCKSLALTSFFPDYHLFYPARAGKYTLPRLRHLSSSPSGRTLINMEYPLGCLLFTIL
jgi:hypothetical protein